MSVFDRLAPFSIPALTNAQIRRALPVLDRPPVAANSEGENTMSIELSDDEIAQRREAEQSMIDDGKLRLIELFNQNMLLLVATVETMRTWPNVDARALATTKTKLDEARLWFGEALK